MIKKDTDFLVALSLQQLFSFQFFLFDFFLFSFSLFVSFAFSIWRSMGILFVYIFWILHNFFLPSNFQPLAQRKNIKCELRRKKTVNFSWHWMQPFILIIRHASHKESQNVNENIFRYFKCAKVCFCWNFNALRTRKRKIEIKMKEKWKQNRIHVPSEPKRGNRMNRIIFGSWNYLFAQIWAKWRKLLLNRDVNSCVCVCVLHHVIGETFRKTEKFLWRLNDLDIVLVVHHNFHSTTNVNWKSYMKYL